MKEDAVKTIVAIGKKFPIAVMYNVCILNCYNHIISSKNEYYHKDEKYIYMLFKEMIKEGILKKEDSGSRVIEQKKYIGDVINNKYEKISISSCLKMITDLLV